MKLHKNDQMTVSRVKDVTNLIQCLAHYCILAEVNFSGASIEFRISRIVDTLKHASEYKKRCKSSSNTVVQK